MKALVIGATGKVGTPTVQSLLRAGHFVRAVVRDEAKARQRLGWHPQLEVITGSLDAGTLVHAVPDADAGFIALGPAGSQGRLQHEIIGWLAGSGLPHLVRLSVLSASPSSLGLNQRAHAELDATARRAGIAYTSVRPALFTTSVIDLAGEIRATGGWEGTAPTGRNAFIDPGDVGACAAAVLGDRSWWGHNWELTGPELLSWPDVAHQLSEVLGRAISYRVVDEEQLRASCARRGLPRASADMLVARDQAVEAHENEKSTDVAERLLRRPRRSLRDTLAQAHADGLL
jgi:uncharacterized protein YbjT (DUF2867 family)